jgi:hypothetical protein
MVNNRRMFGAMLPASSTAHTYDREKQAFVPGEPEYGAHFADEPERIVQTTAPTPSPPSSSSPWPDRRACCAAEGLSEAAARDLRQARYPA